jgi:hypothetical protein
MSIVEETAVAIDLRIGAFGKNFRDPLGVQRRSEFRASRLLDTVRRPQNLRLASKCDQLPRRPSGVTGREAPVVRRVPVLRRDHEWKLRLHPIRHRNHFVAAWHGQRTSREEIILKIN